jgi:hypothetical protein
VSWDSEALRIPATAYAQTLAASGSGQTIENKNVTLGHENINGKYT